jgi:hypothetical protein
LGLDGTRRCNAMVFGSPGRTTSNCIVYKTLSASAEQHISLIVYHSATADRIPAAQFHFQCNSQRIVIIISPSKLHATLLSLRMVIHTLSTVSNEEQSKPQLQFHSDTVPLDQTQTPKGQIPHTNPAVPLTQCHAMISRRDVRFIHFVWPFPVPFYSQ